MAKRKHSTQLHICHEVLGTSEDGSKSVPELLKRLR